MTTMRQAGTAARARGARTPRRPKALVYPETDGKPMAETPIHYEEMVRLQQMLAYQFRNDPTILVGADIMLYWVPGDPKQSLSPDVYIAKGVERDRPRRVYLVWEEGAPVVVIELTSRATRRQDLGRKREIYARIRVPEYFLYDPLGEWLEPRLQGYRLVGEGYERIKVTDGGLLSEELGLQFVVEDREIQVYEPATGTRLQSPGERARRAELRADAAEARIAELEALLRERQRPT